MTGFRWARVVSTLASTCVLLSACGGSVASTASDTKSTSAASGTSRSTTTTVSTAGGTGTKVPSSSTTTTTAPGVLAAFDMVSWTGFAYPDQSQCVLPGSEVVSPLGFDATISGAPYYFRGGDGQDYAVVPLRCIATNSLTDMVLLYQGTGTSKPKLLEVLVAGSSPASSFGVPVETVATSFTAVLAPEGTFANFHSGSLALCGGVTASTSGIEKPYYLNSFFFTEQGTLFTLVSRARSSQPSSSGVPCPGA